MNKGECKGEGKKEKWKRNHRIKRQGMVKGGKRERKRKLFLKRSWKRKERKKKQHKII